jgi:hypothetical protein
MLATVINTFHKQRLLCTKSTNCYWMLHVRITCIATRLSNRSEYIWIKIAEKSLISNTEKSWNWHFQNFFLKTNLFSKMIISHLILNWIASTKGTINRQECWEPNCHYKLVLIRFVVTWPVPNIIFEIIFKKVVGILKR